MNKNNNSTSKMVDEKISCDSSIKGKLLRTFNTVNYEINSSNVKIKNGLKKMGNAHFMSSMLTTHQKNYEQTSS